MTELQTGTVDDVELVVDDTGTAWITLDRPDKRNALTIAMWRRLGDICRGLALWMIVINHTPGNWVGGFTLKNFAFADATEAFVLLAGYAGAFAYAGQADRQGWAPAAASLIRRIAKLYVAHIFLLVVFTAQVGFFRVGNKAAAAIAEKTK